MNRHLLALAASLALGSNAPVALADTTTVRFATFNASLNRDASGQLLNKPAIDTTVVPSSPGGTAAASYPSNNGSANATRLGDPAQDTADFNDAAPGNLRVDYVLPSANLAIQGAGIVWPVDPDTTQPNTTGDLFDLVGTFRDPNLYANLAS